MKTTLDIETNAPSSVALSSMPTGAAISQGNRWHRRVARLLLGAALAGIRRGKLMRLAGANAGVEVIHVETNARVVPQANHLAIHREIAVADSFLQRRGVRCRVPRAWA
ncbi:MAG TPA: hypothetical protein VF807_01290 [Ktedonobacterales bacterium]